MSKLRILTMVVALTMLLAASAAAAQQARPIDHMTAYMVYQKLSGEPTDFEGIARQLHRVRSAPPAQEARVQAEAVAALRRFYASADPEVTYVLQTRTRMTYVHGSGRLDVQLFSGDLVMRMDAFGQQDEWMISGTQNRARYLRNLTFINDAEARFVPIDDARMAPVVLAPNQPETVFHNIIAEVRFRIVEAAPHQEEWRKSLQVMIESVTYHNRSAGLIGQRWPLPASPIPVAAAEIPETRQAALEYNDVLGFYLLHKKAGTTPDFAALAQMTRAVQQAPQFEKAAVAAAEAARMQRDFEATDPEATYLVNLESMLIYELEDEHFRARSLAPDRVLHIRPLGGLGAQGRLASGANERAWLAHLTLDNASRYEVIPLPRAVAADMPEVFQRGQVLAVLGIEMKAVGAGPATREAPVGTLRMEIQAIHLHPSRRGGARAAVNWPFTDPVVR